MALQKIDISAFRNLSAVSLDVHPECNLIFGNNATGKTNLLEAIHVICSGRSFRNYQLTKCIPEDGDYLLLFGLFSEHRAGVYRDRKSTRIKVDAEVIHRISELTARAPVSIIHERCFELVCGPPDIRRSFIDWTVFHVEHQDRQIWNEYNRALRQKNRLLRDQVQGKELQLWDQELTEKGIKIQQLRQHYLEKVNKAIGKLNQHDLLPVEIGIRFIPGWDMSEPMATIKIKRERELKVGHSLCGAHRDRLVFTLNDRPVCDKASRGQLRRIGILALLASARVVAEEQVKPLIVLFDDLEAELDHDAVTKILKILKDINGQVFITNIREQDYLTDFFTDSKMFHVEHGMIREAQK